MGSPHRFSLRIGSIHWFTSSILGRNRQKSLQALRHSFREVAQLIGSPHRFRSRIGSIHWFTSSILGRNRQKPLQPLRHSLREVAELMGSPHRFRSRIGSSCCRPAAIHAEIRPKSPLPLRSLGRLSLAHPDSEFAFGAHTVDVQRMAIVREFGNPPVRQLACQSLVLHLRHGAAIATDGMMVSGGRRL